MEIAGGLGAAAMRWFNAGRIGTAPRNTYVECNAGFLWQLLVALVHSGISGYRHRAEITARSFLIMHTVIVFHGRGRRVRM